MFVSKCNHGDLDLSTIFRGSFPWNILNLSPFPVPFIYDDDSGPLISSLVHPYPFHSHSDCFIISPFPYNPPFTVENRSPVKHWERCLQLLPLMFVLNLSCWSYVYSSFFLIPWMIQKYEMSFGIPLNQTRRPPHSLLLLFGRKLQLNSLSVVNCSVIPLCS